MLLANLWIKQDLDLPSMACCQPQQKLQSPQPLFAQSPWYVIALSVARFAIKRFVPALLLLRSWKTSRARNVVPEVAAVVVSAG